MLQWESYKGFDLDGAGCSGAGMLHGEVLTAI